MKHLAKVAIISGACLFAGQALAQQAGITPPAAPVAVEGGGIINIGQAFGSVMQPYVDAAINALILAFVSWLGVVLKQKFDINIDQAHQAAWARAAQNQAGSLIADGFVKMDGLKVNVNNQALATAARDAIASIPDAAAHLGLTPDYVAARITDMIPQIAAGAQMIGDAHKSAAAAALPGGAGPKV